MKKTAFLMAILLCCAVLFSSCERLEEHNEPAATTADLEPVDMASLELSEYVTLGEYTGMTVEYFEEEDKDDLLWSRVLANATLIKYPDQQVDYYFNQRKSQYIHMAEKLDSTYEETLTRFGQSEEKFLDEARELAFGDLVLYSIIKAEKIELTDEDKSNNFDKYITKYTDIGYTEEYIRQNLKEQIYDTMLYDKTMEKLILLNELVKVE